MFALYHLRLCSIYIALEVGVSLHIYKVTINVYSPPLETMQYIHSFCNRSVVTTPKDRKYYLILQIYCMVIV